MKYLGSLPKTKPLHHTQVKASFRKCFDVPIYEPPNSDIVDQAFHIRIMLDMINKCKESRRTRIFHVYGSMSFILDILRLYRGENNVLEENVNTFGKMVLEKAIALQVELQDLVYFECPITKEIATRLCKICKEIEELFCAITDPLFVQLQTYIRVETFKEELIQKTCHPKRVQWWMDTAEYCEIFGNV